MTIKKVNLDNETLSDITTQVEQEIIKRYKRKCVGIIAGFTAFLSLIAFFGISSLKESIADAIIEKLIKGDFKTEIISKVSDKISEESKKILEKIEEHRNKAELLVDDFEFQHKEILEAASNEFERTINVLKRVRDNTKDKKTPRGEERK